MRVFKTAWFVRFTRTNGISATVLRDAVSRADRGLIDANLGSGVIKQRLLRPGDGRSGGFRAILLFRPDERAVFVYGFAKRDRANLRPDETKELKKMAPHVLGLSDYQINVLVRGGQLEEVMDDGAEAPE
ncbi:MAG: type II toxin-antitoxin system RelE/ParE family toxin [Thermoleophilia bacterium]